MLCSMRPRLLDFSSRPTPSSLTAVQPARLQEGQARPGVVDFRVRDTPASWFAPRRRPPRDGLAFIFFQRGLTSKRLRAETVLWPSRTLITSASEQASKRTQRTCNAACACETRFPSPQRPFAPSARLPLSPSSALPSPDRPTCETTADDPLPAAARSKGNEVPQRYPRPSCSFSPVRPCSASSAASASDRSRAT
ncbi:hypothetical protein BJY59DRAFT_701226 [Rhodotorula toruloides]